MPPVAPADKRPNVEKFIVAEKHCGHFGERVKIFASLTPEQSTRRLQFFISVDPDNRRIYAKAHKYARILKGTPEERGAAANSLCLVANNALTKSA